MKKLILVFDRILNLSFLYLSIRMNCYYPFESEGFSLSIHLNFSEEKKDCLSKYLLFRA